MEYYSSIKSNELLINAITWMNLKIMMLSKRGKTKIEHIVIYICIK